MVKEYTERLYIPAAKSHEDFERDNCAAATALSQWKAKMRKDWPQVRIYDVQVGNTDRQNILVGESLAIQRAGSSRRGRSETCARRSVSRRSRERRDQESERDGSQRKPADGDGSYIYHGTVPASESGTYGFSVRVVPTHPHLMQTHELRLDHLVVASRCSG